MNWIKRIFNWKKAPKATNEMKPIDREKLFQDKSDYIYGIDPFNVEIDDEIYVENLRNNETKCFVYERYWRVKKSWRRSPKNYYAWISDDGDYELIKYNTPNGIEMLVGNLYTLYQQYYGKENKD